MLLLLMEAATIRHREGEAATEALLAETKQPPVGGEAVGLVRKEQRSEEKRDAFVLPC
jgi:hypothetical protein